jgi:hypothetical protein
MPAERNFFVVTNEQLYIAVGIPLLFNATLIGVLIAYVNAKFQASESRFDAIDRRFDAIDRRLDAIDRRFDDMCDLWREEVLDTRLKHLERG